MHNTELHLGLGKHRLDRLGEPFEAIDTGNKTILHPAVLQFCLIRTHKGMRAEAKKKKGKNF